MRGNLTAGATERSDRTGSSVKSLESVTARDFSDTSLSPFSPVPTSQREGSSTRSSASRSSLQPLPLGSLSSKKKKESRGRQLRASPPSRPLDDSSLRAESRHELRGAVAGRLRGVSLAPLSLLSPRQPRRRRARRPRLRPSREWKKRREGSRGRPPRSPFASTAGKCLAAEPRPSNSQIVPTQINALPEYLETLGV